ncbi:MAG: glycoside hydrolase family 78 protein, partial [bacterium]|nr:glycoside hydrolase family 78 protein [bacterium]
SEECVRSDEGWRCAVGPVVESNVYGGERYDARREQAGWSTKDFCDVGWEEVVVMDGPGGRMEEQCIPPIRVVERLRPVSVRRMGRGRYIVDMGQNFAGWVRIRVRGERGRAIRLRFAERLDEGGELDPATTGVAATGVEQVDTYICRGEGVEEWEPRFTYHGFRYVEVSGWPGELKGDEVSGAVVHTDLKVAGGFECSDERLNMLHRMAVWTHRSNVHSVPEDCPTRERCGWLGDANVVAEYSLWNFDSASFWKKYLDDIETTRSLHGGLPCNIAPGKRTCGMARADWALAFVMIPWYVYVHTGEVGVLRDHWEGMDTLMRHLAGMARGGLLEDGFGDWCEPGSPGYVKNTPVTLTTSAWFSRAACVMSKVATMVGEGGSAAWYRDLGERVRGAIRERYLDAVRWTFGSQTGNVLAVEFGIVEEDEAVRVVESLVEDLRGHGMHLTTGIMGVRYIFEVLSRYGRGEEALAILHEDSYPSFGDMIKRGATTLWEGWGEPEGDESGGVCSLNHPMKGGYDNWFYTTLGGIVPDEREAGFRHVWFGAKPVAGVEWVRVWHETGLGRFESAWWREGKELVWEVRVPEGGRGTVVLPYSGRTELIGAGRHILREEEVVGEVK